MAYVGSRVFVGHSSAVRANPGGTEFRPASRAIHDSLDPFNVRMELEMGVEVED